MQILPDTLWITNNCTLYTTILPGSPDYETLAPLSEQWYDGQVAIQPVLFAGEMMLAVRSYEVAEIWRLDSEEDRWAKQIGAQLPHMSNAERYVLALAVAIVEVLLEEGPSPAGTMYLAFNSSGLSYEVFNSLTTALVTDGHITRSNHILTATEQGRAWRQGARRAIDTFRKVHHG